MARRSLARRLVVAGAAVVVVRWLVAQGEPQVPAPVEPPQEELPDAAAVRSAPVRYRTRFAAGLTFAALFCAGGALSAGAGNLAAHVDDASTDPAAVAAAVPITDDATTDVAATDPAVTTEAVVTTEAAATDPTPTVTSSTPAVTPDAAPDPSDDAITVKSVTPATQTGAAAPSVTVAAPTHKTLPKRYEPAKRPPTRKLAVMPIPVAALAFDPQAWLKNNAASATGASAVAIAEHYLGVPYRWGGAEPATGFDCSGLTQFVYDQLGVYLPHYAASQFDAYTKLDPSQLEPGDLVFFEPKLDGPGHVAIYIGNDQIIEAPHTGALIRISALSGEAAKLGFLGAVRPYTETQVAASPVGSIVTRLD